MSTHAGRQLADIGCCTGMLAHVVTCETPSLFPQHFFPPPSALHAPFSASPFSILHCTLGFRLFLTWVVGLPSNCFCHPRLLCARPFLVAGGTYGRRFPLCSSARIFPLSSRYVVAGCSWPNHRAEYHLALLGGPILSAAATIGRSIWRNLPAFAGHLLQGTSLPSAIAYSIGIVFCCSSF